MAQQAFAQENFTMLPCKFSPPVPYFNPLECTDNIIVSCDMIKIRFVVLKSIMPGIRSGVECFFSQLKDIDVKWQTDFFNRCYPSPNQKFGSYKYFANVTDGYEGSMRCSAGLYTSDGMREIVDVELNPNKCFSTAPGYASPITDLFQWLAQHSKSIIVRWFDLATDYYGVNREAVISWVADRRTPVSYGKGKIRQQSFGQNKHHGYLKIYNKADERQKGADGIVRIELTLKAPFDIDEAQRLFGTHICDAGKMSAKQDPMTQALIRLEHYSVDDVLAVLHCMSTNTRKKYKKILEQGTRILSLPRASEDGVPLEDWFAGLLKSLLGDEYGLLQ